MNGQAEDLERWRAWFPIPVAGRGAQLRRWLFLEGNRYAVTVSPLLGYFITIIVIGTVWAFEIERLLTETTAIQNLLNTFLNGIILLVSIVVSINSIVLSYDISSMNSQQDRIEATVDFRRKLGQIGIGEETPTDMSSFLRVITDAIQERAQVLVDETKGTDGEFAVDVANYCESVVKMAEDLDKSLHRSGGGEFGMLWIGLETDYSLLMDQSQSVASKHQDDIDSDTETQLEELLQILELFATGREYFKTLYYTREISKLSRTLLLVSLPAILITATAILAINANLLPNIWFFGLPPLLSFVAAAFTIALTPFLILTAYMLQLTTVALRTSAAGTFVLRP